MAPVRYALAVAVVLALLVTVTVAAPVDADVDRVEEGQSVLNELARDAEEAELELPTVPSENEFEHESESHSEGGSAEDELAALDVAEEDAERDARLDSAEMASLHDLDADLDALAVSVDGHADHDQAVEDVQDLGLDEDEDEEEADVDLEGESEEDLQLDMDLYDAVTPAKKVAPAKPVPKTNKPAAKTTTTTAKPAKPATATPTAKPATGAGTGTGTPTATTTPPPKRYAGTEQPFQIWAPWIKAITAQPTQQQEWEKNKSSLCRCMLPALLSKPKICYEANGLLNLCRRCSTSSCTATKCPNLCGMSVSSMKAKDCVDMVELAGQAKKAGKTLPTACDALLLPKK